MATSGASTTCTRCATPTRSARRRPAAGGGTRAPRVGRRPAPEDAGGSVTVAAGTTAAAGAGAGTRVAGVAEAAVAAAVAAAGDEAALERRADRLAGDPACFERVRILSQDPAERVRPVLI